MVTLSASQLQRTTPEAQGIASSAILRFVQAVEGQIHELHSFMLLRHGAVVAEGWWSPYAANRPHMLYSLSKSFASTAIGFAVAEKRLTVDDQVLALFPDNTPAQVSENLAAMRVRHLLSMNTGHDEDTVPYLRTRADGDWVKAFLECPVVYQPGTHFLYNSGATFMLSAIITELTGLKLIDYLTPRLFEPLGIEGATWEEAPSGMNIGWAGLNIKTEDIARLGQLYLQKGLWNGTRILSEAWIEEATSYHSDNSSQQSMDWAQGYGYQFWRCRHNAYRGDGAFGQYCIVMPEQDAVLAITSGVADMQSVLDVVWDHLLPALNGSTLPDHPADQQALASKLSSLAYQPPQGQHVSPVGEQVSGRVYALDPNPFNLQTLTVDFADAECILTVKTTTDTTRIHCGYGAWQEQMLAPLTPYVLVAASGVWTSEDTFTIMARRFSTPYVYTVALCFAGDQITITGDVNVAFDSAQQHVTLTARRVQGS